MYALRQNVVCSAITKPRTARVRACCATGTRQSCSTPHNTELEHTHSHHGRSMSHLVGAPPRVARSTEARHGDPHASCHLNPHTPAVSTAPTTRSFSCAREGRLGVGPIPTSTRRDGGRVAYRSRRTQLLPRRAVLCSSVPAATRGPHPAYTRERRMPFPRRPLQRSPWAPSSANLTRGQRRRRSRQHVAFAGTLGAPSAAGWALEGSERTDVRCDGTGWEMGEGRSCHPVRLAASHSASTGAT